MGFGTHVKVFFRGKNEQKLKSIIDEHVIGHLVIDQEMVLLGAAGQRRTTPVESFAQHENVLTVTTKDSVYELHLSKQSQEATPASLTDTTSMKTGKDTTRFSISSILNLIKKGG